MTPEPNQVEFQNPQGEPQWVAPRQARPLIPEPNQVEFQNLQGELQWVVTADGKVRGPVVRRFLLEVGLVSGFSAGAGALLSRAL